MNRLLCIAAATLLAGPALAQYKVVGPDGRVTYTDRPPATAPAAPVAAARSAASPYGSVSLPYELQQAVSRFPVVLYTMANCSLCDDARRMLQQRGIPLSERVVQQAEDLALVEQRTGGRGMPVMTVGSQAIHGYGESQWTSLLDLAGYPRQSRLPPGYVAAAPAPVTPRAAVPIPRAEPDPAPPSPAATEPEPTPPATPGIPPIRF